ncbi:hypothetical protein HU200_011802 [Digitaria exilis]|uniref:DUF1618 domain-containing protein n=1 Tax=Digitaria exilis TaxID=1010633 RepID=A0A835FFT8_9POAL|nr:hypothetical protein HU200_011802 [Digitaria exilis]
MAALALDGKKSQGVQWELRRLRTEAEERALAILRERKAKAAASGGDAVRKLPVVDSDWYDADYLREILEGIELCIEEVAPPSVASLTLNLSWPPNHPLWSRPVAAFVTNCHQRLILLCFGEYCPCNFYVVYDTSANSVAIVPPLPHMPRYYSDIGGSNGGVAVLCLDDGGFLLTELFRHRDGNTLLLTDKATLFTWVSYKWEQREVALPLPLLAAEDDDEPFCADTVFPVGSHNSLAWVDLLKGILIYCHSDKRFEFIELPSDADAKLTRKRNCPERYRSMCCFNGGDTFKFAAMDGFNKGDSPLAEVVLKIWTLSLVYDKDGIRQWRPSTSVRIGDFWCNQLYKDVSFIPTFPVLSTVDHGIIYVTVTDYKYSREHAMWEPTKFYVLSLGMRLCKVVSSFRIPDRGGFVADQRIITSHFTNYLNQARRPRGDEYEQCRPRGEEVADEEEARSNPDAWTSLWNSSGKQVVEPRTGRSLFGASAHISD